MMSVSDVGACFGSHGDHAQRTLIGRCLNKRWFADVCVSLVEGAHPVSVQRWAYEAIARTPGSRHGRLARRGLRSEAMTIRLHTLIGIASSRIPGRIDWLFDLLHDESGGIRLNALEALLELRPRSIRKELPRMSDDPKVYVRRAASEALRRMAADAIRCTLLLAACVLGVGAGSGCTADGVAAKLTDPIPALERGGALVGGEGVDDRFEWMAPTIEAPCFHREGTKALLAYGNVTASLGRSERHEATGAEAALSQGARTALRRGRP